MHSLDDRDGTSRKGKADPDSRARTHLANERTFLAWLRTGLALVALGLAAAQFLQSDLVPGIPVTTLFSLFLVLSGVAIGIVGGVHYHHAREEIDAGAFLPSKRIAIFGIGIVLVAGALAFFLVILLRVRG